MANDYYIEQDDRDLEDAAAYEAQQHREADCLQAFTECVLKGVDFNALKTIQREMGVDKRDADTIITQCLKIKFSNMEKWL